MQIITYGCSYTNYIYPTYADILALDYAVNNKAFPGSGNERILYSIMSDYHSKALLDYDCIIVQWSHENRFNYLNNKNVWLGNGSIFNNDNKHILNKIEKWYNIDYELQKTIDLTVCIKFLLSSLNKKLYFMTMSDLANLAKNKKINLDFININNLQERYKGGYEFDDVTWKRDDHPTLLEHLEIAQNVATFFEMDLSKNTKRRVKQLHNQIINQRVFKKYSL